MRLEITDTERTVLVEVLDQVYRDLKEEIYKTETDSFKEQLKTREQTLIDLLEKLRRDPGTRVAA